MKDVYIVFSATPYKMGKFIRTFTRGEFNHASIMFDENMCEAYSFGRRHIDTPFYGGIIKDSVSRYVSKNGKKRAYINICKIQVEDDRYYEALNTAKDMFANKDDYVYNLLSAGHSVAGKRIFIKDSYTCVEFCVFLLSMMTDNVKKDGFYSVTDLYAVYKDFSIYNGEFNISGNVDEDFISEKGFKVAIKGGTYVVKELIKRRKQG